MLLASGATIDSRNITGGMRVSAVGGEDQMIQMTAERDAKNQQHIFCLLQKNGYQYGVRCNQKRPVFLVSVRPPTTVCSTQTMVSNASQNPIKKLFGI